MRARRDCCVRPARRVVRALPVADARPCRRDAPARRSTHGVGLFSSRACGKCCSRWSGIAGLGSPPRALPCRPCEGRARDASARAAAVRGTTCKLLSVV